MAHSVKKLNFQPLPTIWRAGAPHCNCGTERIALAGDFVFSQFLASCRFQRSDAKMILFNLSRMLSSAITLLFIPAFCGGSQPPSFLHLCGVFCGSQGRPSFFAKALARAGLLLAEGSFTADYFLFLFSCFASTSFLSL